MKLYIKMPKVKIFKRIYKNKVVYYDLKIKQREMLITEVFLLEYEYFVYVNF